eukprot:m51a1_g9190 hypothetical protein (387) ;mRNA; r:80222-81463
METGTCLADLPEEALVTVLGWLDPRSIASAALCCRSLRSVSRNERVWRAAAARLGSSQARDEAVATPLERSWRLACERRLRNGPLLDEARKYDDIMRGYSGCTALIARGYAALDRDERRAAWEAVRGSVAVLTGLHEFLHEQAAVLAALLEQLCAACPETAGSGVLDAWRAFWGQQAPSPQRMPVGAVLDFAELAQFWFSFDFHKMTAPQLQNDFCFFHRYSNAFKEGSASESAERRNLDMMFFLSQSSPIMTNVRASLAACGIGQPALSAALGRLANEFFLRATGSPQSALPPMGETLAASGLAAALLLYDTATADNKYSFGARCPFPVARVLELLRDQQAAAHPRGSRPPLVNFVRYFTQHLSPLSTASAGTDREAMRILAELP